MTREAIALPQDIERRLPPEKSWYGNLALMALIEENPIIVDSLRGYDIALPDDLLAVCQSTDKILSGATEIEVGEGGAWARKLSFASAAFGWGLTLVKSGTLRSRPDDFIPDMTTASLGQLGALNQASSQLASAAVLCGSPEPIPDGASYHLQLAYEARDYWRERLDSDPIPLRRDRTLRRHTQAWLGWLSSNQFELEPVQREDYPILRIFGGITTEEALGMGWDSLVGHESSRFKSVDYAIQLAEQGEPVPYSDHRICQGLRMRYGQAVLLEHPDAISKSWAVADFDVVMERGYEIAGAQA